MKIASFSYYNLSRTTLHVPESSIGSYSNASFWSSFGSIVALSTSDYELPCAVIANNNTREYGADNPEFGYAVAGGELKGTPVISCSATKSSPVGTYDIVISRGSVENQDVVFVNGTLTIEPAPLTVTARSYVRKEKEPNPTFEMDYDGFKNDETEAVLTTKPTATTVADENSEPGTYDIIVSGGAADNYILAYVNGKLTVVEACKITLIANSMTREYGDENPVFGYTVVTDDGLQLEGTPEVTCEGTIGSPAGTYPIRISRGTVTNENLILTDGELTVTKAPLTAYINSQRREYGQPNPTFEIHYKGFKNGDTEAVLQELPVVVNNVAIDAPVGDYRVNLEGGRSDRYKLTCLGTYLIVSVPSGIEALMATGQPFDVYSTTGLMVRRQTTTLKGLSRGIYLINGQKIVVK